MKISEKLGYVRGLADGLNIESTTPEGKLLLALTELVTDMAEAITDLGGIVSDMEDDMDGLYIELMGGEDDDDEDGRTIPFPRLHDADEDAEDDDEDSYEFDDDGEMPSPPCPHCRTPIDITPEILENGSVDCPGCGQKLMLEIRGGCGCDDGCGCGGHDHESHDHDGHEHGGGGCGCGCGHDHE